MLINASSFRLAGLSESTHLFHPEGPASNYLLGEHAKNTTYLMSASLSSPATLLEYGKNQRAADLADVQPLPRTSSSPAPAADSRGARVATLANAKHGILYPSCYKSQRRHHQLRALWGQALPSVNAIG